MSDVDVKYKKENDAKDVTITIKAQHPMTMLDVLRALSSIMTQILTTGKY